MSKAVKNTNLVAHAKALDAINAFDQVRAMTWRLLNPKSEIRNPKF